MTQRTKWLRSQRLAQNALLTASLPPSISLCSYDSCLLLILSLFLLPEFLLLLSTRTHGWPAHMYCRNYALSAAATCCSCPRRPAGNASRWNACWPRSRKAGQSDGKPVPQICSETRGREVEDVTYRNRSSDPFTGQCSARQLVGQGAQTVLGSRNSD